MMRLYSRVVGLAVVVLLIATATSAQDNRAGAQPEISFTVSMSKPSTHLFEVEIRVRGARLPSQVNLIMPVWTPGSYLIREYERNVQDFAAADAASERSLAWQKINKDTWRIETNGARELRVTYRVYANDLTVRTNELNDRHGFWNNAALLMYPEGDLNAPSTLRVVPFNDWKVATGLPAVSGKPNFFRAENFDILYDSPFDAGKFKIISFEVRGVPHRIVIDGEGNYDAERLRRDVQKIVETEVAIMGDIPYHDYTFIVHSTAQGGGGLEHLNSTSLMFERNSFRQDDKYKDVLSVFAHEFFHLWNVKRIRPDALGPFDYTKENYTKLLWAAEGITEYYATIALRRSGIITEEEFLNRISNVIGNVQNTPGRLLMSVEEASFDAWIKFYRPDENYVNSQISYYDKGELLGLLLDLQIRKSSNGAKSLDDVLRYLYAEFYKRNRNYTPEDFQRASELMAGTSLENFFARYVRGRDELDYNAALNTVGLQLGEAASTKPPAETTNLGIRTSQQGERLMISSVYSGTPAYDQGLNTGDQIIAFDGERVNQQSFTARLGEKHPGDIINLTLFRNDDLRAFAIKLGKRIVTDYRIVPVKEPTPEQTRQYHAWLSAT